MFLTRERHVWAYNLFDTRKEFKTFEKKINHVTLAIPIDKKGSTTLVFCGVCLEKIFMTSLRDSFYAYNIHLECI